jgi:hypothetical protein
MPDPGPVAGPLQRLRYFKYEFLTAGDFQLEQDYHRKMLRYDNLYSRTPGVSWGLDVQPDPNNPGGVVVTAGMATDSAGRQLILEDATTPWGLAQHDPGATVHIMIAYDEENFGERKTGSGDEYQYTLEKPQIWSDTNLPATGTSVVLGSVTLDGNKVVQQVEYTHRQRSGVVDVWLFSPNLDPGPVHVAWSGTQRLDIAGSLRIVTPPAAPNASSLTVAGSLGVNTTSAPVRTLDVGGAAFFRPAEWPGPLGNSAGLTLGFDPGLSAMIVAHQVGTVSAQLTLSANPLVISDAQHGQLGQFDPDGLWVNAGVVVDGTGQGDGTVSSQARPRGLLFGKPGSGEAIVSNRLAGWGLNVYGLDLVTQYKNRLSITNAGNVGIGTQSPSALLHVRAISAGTVSQIIETTDTGPTARAQLLVRQSLTRGLVAGVLSPFGPSGRDLVAGALTVEALPDAAQLAFNHQGIAPITFHTSNWNERVRITSDGKVGIGTKAPDALLHVRSDSAALPSQIIESTVGQAGAQVIVRESPTKGIVAGLFGTTNQAFVDLVPGSAMVAAYADAAQLAFNHGGSGPITLHTSNWNERMRITSDGKVGIGTKAPMGMLHVRSSSAGVVSQILETTDAGPSGGATLLVRQSLTRGLAAGVLSPVNPAFRDLISGSATVEALPDAAQLAFNHQGTGPITFHTSNWNERLRITSDGKVGIGTKTPDALLHLRSDAAALARQIVETSSTAAQAGAQLIVRESSTKGIVAGLFGSGNPAFVDLVPGTAMVAALADASQLAFNHGGSGPITLHTSNWHERMRITSDGKVGIGTKAPEDALQVGAGNGKVTMGSLPEYDYLYFANAYLGLNAAHTSSGWTFGTDTANNGGAAILSTVTGGLCLITKPPRDPKNQTDTVDDHHIMPFVGLTIDANQRVGIGTAGPQSRLHVASGAIQPEYGDSHNAGITWPQLPGHGKADEAWIRYHLESGSETMRLRMGIENDWDDRLSLWQMGGDRVTLYNGKVGINNDSPVQQLDIVGTLQCSDWFLNSSTRTYLTGSDGYGHWIMGMGMTEGVHNAIALTSDHRVVMGWPLYADGGLWTTGHKGFLIDHPLDPEHKKLAHASLEGPEAGVYYRGAGQLSGGSATIALPEYFEALVSDDGRTVQLTAAFDRDDEEVSILAASKVEAGCFTVQAVDGRNPSQRFYWEVKGVRCDIDELEVEVDKPLGAELETSGVVE